MEMTPTLYVLGGVLLGAVGITGVFWLYGKAFQNGYLQKQAEYQRMVELEPEEEYQVDGVRSEHSIALFEKYDIVFDREFVDVIAKGRLALEWDRVFEDIYDVIDRAQADFTPDINTVIIRSAQLMENSGNARYIYEALHNPNLKSLEES